MFKAQKSLLVHVITFYVRCLYLECGQDFNARQLRLVGRRTQFKHFSECFLGNSVHFVRLEYFVIVRGLIFCPSVAAAMFSFSFDTRH